MQASLEIRRFPVTFVAVVLGIAIALFLGLGLGYTLKATSVTGPAKVLVVAADSFSAQDPCVWAGKHKDC